MKKFKTRLLQEYSVSWSLLDKSRSSSFFKIGTNHSMYNRFPHIAYNMSAFKWLFYPVNYL